MFGTASRDQLFQRQLQAIPETTTVKNYDRPYETVRRAVVIIVGIELRPGVFRGLNHPDYDNQAVQSHNNPYQSTTDTRRERTTGGRGRSGKATSTANSSSSGEPPKIPTGRVVSPR